MSQFFADAAAVVDALRPDQPVYCLRTHTIAAMAERFIAGFPGKVMYAVKCNDDRRVLRALYEGGIRHFDTASLGEVVAVHGEFERDEGVACHFMHPVKNRRAIREAYQRMGVRSFALDSLVELEKILQETGGADDLTLIVRLEMPRNQAVMDLGGKFGLPAPEAARLLQEIAARGYRCGLTFHVGSQCLDPGAYRVALERVGQVLELSGVAISVLDVGGGFPARYDDQSPPPLECFFDAIRDGLARLDLPSDVEVFCEPGRALVAEAMSLIVRVEMRRGAALYLNDGVYGNLSDLKFFGTRLPMRVHRPEGAPPLAAQTGFELFGPTCDSFDSLPGPYLLAADVGEGDWIEFGQAGAYTNALQTDFNGFFADLFVIIGDEPMLPSWPRLEALAA